MDGFALEVGVNGTLLWGFVIAQSNGYRVRFPIDDWERLRLAEGRKVPVRLAGMRDLWLVVTDVSEDPPVVWVTLAGRVG